MRKQVTYLSEYLYYIGAFSGYPLKEVFKLRMFISSNFNQPII